MSASGRLDLVGNNSLWSVSPAAISGGATGTATLPGATGRPAASRTDDEDRYVGELPFLDSRFSPTSAAPAHELSLVSPRSGRGEYPARVLSALKRYIDAYPDKASWVRGSNPPEFQIYSMQHFCDSGFSAMISDTASARQRRSLWVNRLAYWHFDHKFARGIGYDRALTISHPSPGAFGPAAMDVNKIYDYASANHKEWGSGDRPFGAPTFSSTGAMPRLPDPLAPPVVENVLDTSDDYDFRLFPQKLHSVLESYMIAHPDKASWVPGSNPPKMRLGSVKHFDENGFIRQTLDSSAGFNCRKLFSKQLQNWKFDSKYIQISVGGGNDSILTIAHPNPGAFGPAGVDIHILRGYKQQLKSKDHRSKASPSVFNPASVTPRLPDQIGGLTVSAGAVLPDSNWDEFDEFLRLDMAGQADFEPGEFSGGAAHSANPPWLPMSGAAGTSTLLPPQLGLSGVRDGTALTEADRSQVDKLQRELMAGHADFQPGVFSGGAAHSANALEYHDPGSHSGAFTASEMLFLLGLHPEDGV